MHKLIAAFVILFSGLSGISQNTIAIPEIVNYSKEALKAGTDNWDACQDDNGLVYFANNEGLLCFDGTRWRLYPLPNRTIVRSLALGQQNRIYVGGQDEIGYFFPDEAGRLSYQSLTQLIPAIHRSFSDVWDITAVSGQILFRSSQKIFLYSNERITVYPTAGEWLFMGLSHKGVIVEDEQSNLLIFDKGTWRRDLRTFLPEKCIVTASVITGKDSTMITTLKHGVYLLSGNNLSSISSPALDKIATESIYSATMVDDEHIALGTAMRGCFIIDKKGALVQHFSRHEGLQNNNILCAFSDRHKNLWLGVSTGVDFVSYGSPIKNIRPDNQNLVSGYSSIIHNNRLYIATSAGLYSASLAGEKSNSDLSLVKADFEPVQNSRGQAWNLSVVNDQLFMGHHEGAYRIENNTAIPVDKSTGFWAFLPFSPVLPSSIMVAGSYKGIDFYTYNDKSIIKTISAPFESARFVTIDDNNIWVSHPYKGVFKVSLFKQNKSSVEFYAEKHGLSTQNNYIFKIKNRVVVATDKGVYEYNANTDKFEPSIFFGKIFGKTVIRYLKEDASGNVWFVFEKKLGVVDFSTGTPKIIYISELNNKLVSGFEQVYPVNDNNVFVGAEKGFFHINYARYKQNLPTVRPQIREVRITGKSDSVLFYGYLSVLKDEPHRTKVPYQWNTFHFDFSVPIYQHQSNIEYSCYLEGYDKRWSEWTSKTEKEYPYLPAGTYNFLVKTRTKPGVESSPGSYSFVVLPPWYQTWWAFAVYALLIMTGIYVAYRWQKKKFIRQTLEYEEKQKRLRHLHQLELEKNEKEIVKLRNENLEAEINHKNKEMASATMHLVKKGEIITRVKDELQRLAKNAGDPQMLDAIRKMIKALSEDENMDANWEHFAMHFDKVHNDFFIALKKQHRNLTPNDLKLCAYLRMNLCTKEMAGLMNISVRGVEISRYRLRKKLQLPTETNLTTYLLDLHGEMQQV